MTRIVFFEGTDGSGKSSLINKLANHLKANNLTCQIVSKESVQGAVMLTNLYKYSDVSPITEVSIRISREFMKADAIEADVDYALVDRSILSLATTIASYDLDWQDYRVVFDDLKTRYGAFTTVFCHTPYEVARERVSARVINEGVKLSRKEAKGFDYNLMIYNHLVQLKMLPELVGQSIISVNTHTLNQEEAGDFLINSVFEGTSDYT